MSTKAEILDEPCYANADDNEPIFILRGQDKLAPALVHAWASLAAEHGCQPEKVASAFKCAAEMQKWHQRKFPALGS